MSGFKSDSELLDKLFLESVLSSFMSFISDWQTWLTINPLIFRERTLFTSELLENLHRKKTCI